MEVFVLRLDGLVRWFIVEGKGGGIKEDALLRVVGGVLREEVDELEGMSTMVSSSDTGMSPWLVFSRRYEDAGIFSWFERAPDDSVEAC